MNNAIRFNKLGVKFSIFGISSGFRSLMLYYTKEKIKFDYFNHLDTSDNTEITNIFNFLVDDNMVKNSYLFKIFKKYITSKNKYLYYNNDENITINNFNSNKNLKNNFNILGTLKVNNKLKIVTMIKHKIYPFIGVQFHPEKIQYINKNGLNIHETLEGRFISFFLSNIFLNLNKNYSKLDNEDFKKLNIKKQNEEIYEGVYNTIYYIRKNLDNNYKLYYYYN